MGGHLETTAPPLYTAAATPPRYDVLEMLPGNCLHLRVLPPEALPQPLPRPLPPAEGAMAGVGRLASGSMVSSWLTHPPTLIASAAGRHSRRHPEASCADSAAPTYLMAL